jgi:mRNA interferase MazF
MTITRAGEVWLTQVEFADGSGSKPRPVLILFSHDQDSVLAVVTSAAPRSPRDLIIGDWQVAGLKRPSTIRLDKLVTTSHPRLWARLGRLTEADWKKVVHLWNQEMRLDVSYTP